MKEKELKENKHLSDNQENTSIMVMEMMRTIQGFKIEFNKEIESYTS